MPDEADNNIATIVNATTDPAPLDASDARLEVIAVEIEGIQAAADRQKGELLAEARAIFRYRRDEGGFTG